MWGGERWRKRSVEIIGKQICRNILTTGLRISNENIKRWYGKEIWTTDCTEHLRGIQKTHTHTIIVSHRIASFKVLRFGKLYNSLGFRRDLGKKRWADWRTECREKKTIFVRHYMVFFRREKQAFPYKTVAVECERVFPFDKQLLLYRGKKQHVECVLQIAWEKCVEDFILVV